MQEHLRTASPAQQNVPLYISHGIPHVKTREAGPQAAIPTLLCLSSDPAALTSSFTSARPLIGSSAVEKILFIEEASSISLSDLYTVRESSLEPVTCILMFRAAEGASSVIFSRSCLAHSIESEERNQLHPSIVKQGLPSERKDQTISTDLHTTLFGSNAILSINSSRTGKTKVMPVPPAMSRTCS